MTRKTALVIEDAKDSAMLLARVLHMLDYDAEIAGDAATALRMVDETAPDLIFCDIGLPEMDGYQLARLLRAKPALIHTRLIAVTGFAPPSSHDEVRALGFDRFVTKPIGIPLLREVVADLEAEDPRPRTRPSKQPGGEQTL